MASTVLEYLIKAAWQGGGEVRQAKSELGQLGEAGAKSSQGLDKASGSAGGLSASIGKLVTGGALLGAGVALAKFGGEAIRVASDVEEAGAKFDTVFGEFADQSEEDLERIADATNRSKYDLIEWASTIQDTLVPLGFARGAAADLSEEVTQLAIDLGSFNNLETDQVIADLQSALVGNVETLRKYGVVANEAAIKQELLNSGLWDGKSAIDAQDKAQAILAITMAGTTDAQGDAVRTADGLANKQRGLEAAVKDLSVALGTILVPAAQESTDWLTQFADAATGAINAAGGNFNANAVITGAFERGLISEAERDQAATAINDWFDLVYSDAEKAEIVRRLTEEIAAYDAEIEKTRRGHLGATRAAGDYNQEMRRLMESMGQADYGIRHYNDGVLAQRRELLLLIDEYDNAVQALGEIAEAQELMRESTAHTGDVFMSSLADVQSLGSLTKFDVAGYLWESADAAGFGAEALADYGLELGTIDEDTAAAVEELTRFKLAVEGANTAFEEGRTSVLEYKTAVGIARLEFENGPTAGIAGEDELGRQAAYWDEIDSNTQKWNETLGLVEDPLQNAVMRVEDLQTRIDTLTGGTWEVPIEADPNGTAQQRLEDIQQQLDDLAGGIVIPITIQETNSGTGGGSSGGSSGGDGGGGDDDFTIDSVPFAPVGIPDAAGPGTGSTGKNVTIVNNNYDQNATAIAMAVARQMAGVG